MTDAAEFARLLGFTPAWFALGVVDDAVLARPYGHVVGVLRWLGYRRITMIDAT